MKILSIVVLSLLLPLHVAANGMLRKAKQQQHRRLPHFTTWDDRHLFFSSPLCGPGTLNMVSGGDVKQRGGLLQVHAQFDRDTTIENEPTCLGTGKLTLGGTRDTAFPVGDSFFDIEYRIDCSGRAGLLAGKVETTNSAGEKIEIEMVQLSLTSGTDHPLPPPAQGEPGIEGVTIFLDVHVWNNARFEYDTVGNTISMVDSVNGNPITSAPYLSYTRTTVTTNLESESCSRLP